MARQRPVSGCGGTPAPGSGASSAEAAPPRPRRNRSRSTARPSASSPPRSTASERPGRGIRGHRAGRLADDLRQVDFRDHLLGETREVDAVDGGVEIQAPSRHGVHVEVGRARRPGRPSPPGSPGRPSPRTIPVRSRRCTIASRWRRTAAASRSTPATTLSTLSCCLTPPSRSMRRASSRATSGTSESRIAARSRSASSRREHPRPARCPSQDRGWSREDDNSGGRGGDTWPTGCTTPPTQQPGDPTTETAATDAPQRQVEQQPERLPVRG